MSRHHLVSRLVGSPLVALLVNLLLVAAAAAATGGGDWPVKR